MKSNLTYANAMATVAVFIALGGSSYALSQIGSREVANNSLRSEDLRNNGVRSVDIRNRTLRERDLGRNALTGGAINEFRLGPVPRATSADLLSGLSAADLRLKCPPGTSRRGAVCLEDSFRSADAFTNAVAACTNLGRELPTFTEFSGLGTSAAGEWTSSIYRSANVAQPLRDQLEVVVRTPTPDGVTFKKAFTADRLPYRCAALPSNN